MIKLVEIVDECPEEESLLTVNLVDGVTICQGPRRSGRTMWAVDQALNALWNAEHLSPLLLTISDVEAKRISQDLLSMGLVGVQVLSAKSALSNMRGATFSAIVVDNADMLAPALLDEIALRAGSRPTHITIEAP